MLGWRGRTAQYRGIVAISSLFADDLEALLELLDRHVVASRVQALLPECAIVIRTVRRSGSSCSGLVVEWADEGHGQSLVSALSTIPACTRAAGSAGGETNRRAGDAKPRQRQFSREHEPPEIGTPLNAVLGRPMIQNQRPGRHRAMVGKIGTARQTTCSESSISSICRVSRREPSNFIPRNSTWPKSASGCRSCSSIAPGQRSSVFR